MTKTVPVRKEVATLETEPITDGNVDAATSGKERVRLGKETVTTDQEVTEEVRKERVETEGDVSAR